MVCRVLHAFGSGVCEALPVQLVNDIFFLHERGKRIGYYTGKPYFQPEIRNRRLADYPLSAHATGTGHPELAADPGWQVFYPDAAVRAQGGAAQGQLPTATGHAGRMKVD